MGARGPGSRPSGDPSGRERRVGRLDDDLLVRVTDVALGRLGEDWHVVRDVFVPSGLPDRPGHTVDHVLVGPPGVFVVGSCRDDSAALEESPVERAADELVSAARALHRQLRWESVGRRPTSGSRRDDAVSVVPLLGVVGGAPTHAAAEVEDRLRAGSPSALVRDLLDRLPVLDPATVSALAGAVRRTTQSGTGAAPPGRRGSDVRSPRRAGEQTARSATAARGSEATDRRRAAADGADRAAVQPRLTQSTAFRAAAGLVAVGLLVVVALAGRDAREVSGPATPPAAERGGSADAAAPASDPAPSAAAASYRIVPAEQAEQAVGIVTARDWGERASIPRDAALPEVRVRMARVAEVEAPIDRGADPGETRWTARVVVDNAGTAPLPRVALSWRLEGTAPTGERWSSDAAEGAAVAGQDPGSSVEPGASGAWDLTWVLPAEVEPDADRVELGRATVTWR